MKSFLHCVLSLRSSRTPLTLVIKKMRQWRIFTKRLKNHHNGICINNHFNETKPWNFYHPLKNESFTLFGSGLQELCLSVTLRRHTYSNILNILPPKNENFQMKNSDIFSYFCSKHRLWVLVRAASTRRF